MSTVSRCLAEVPQTSENCKSAAAGSLHSVQMVESVFRRFKDFDPFKGTPIDIMHNMESGIMKDLLEVPHTAPKSKDSVTWSFGCRL